MRSDIRFSVSLTIFFLLTLSFSVQAQTTGTGNGTYDFGSLGSMNSGGSGFKTQGDKFKVSNIFEADATVIYANNASDGTSQTVTIKAEGGSVCKRFTLKNMLFYNYNVDNDLSQFNLVLKDASGTQIASHSLSANQTIYGVGSSTALTAFNNLNPAFPAAGYANVSEIVITWKYADASISPDELTFATITVADVSATLPSSNSAPTDISLSASTIAENAAANATIGTLSSTDPDAGASFTYTLVAGTGDTDNASFNISGSNLRITNSPNFESKSSYSVRIRTTDQGGLTYEEAFAITITNVNEDPTDVALSASSVNENVAGNTTVGTLSSTDPDAGASFTYTLVAGTGDTDNASFNISGSNLRITNSPNFESKSSYSVRIRTTDQGGLTYEEAFAITITNVNEDPTDVALSASSVNENVAGNTTVGTLNSTDVDAGASFTYTLVAGTGDTDNASFNISGSNLRITNSPNFESKNSYSVRIRTTDQGGLTYEEAFAITITNVNEDPTDLALSATSVNENVPGNTTVGTLSTTDPDAGATFTYTLVAGTGDTDNASFNISGSNLRITNSPDYETQNSYNVRIRTTDQGGLTYEEAFVISVSLVNGAPTDLMLSASSVNENVTGNTTVGTLSSTDPDAGATFTYTLVAGTGDTDNASFNISGSNLRITNSPDYESKNSYSVRVRTTDQGGLTYEEAFAITITSVNEDPTDVALSASSVNENVAGNTTVGTLSSTDADAGATFTYTLVAGTGDTDNASFNISGSNLRITNSPNFESKSSYSVRVRTTDQGGLTYEEAFAITVANVNEDPTDLALSASSVNENVAGNTTVGTLSSTDVDAGATFTYTLVAGTGDTDNASFNISGSNLRITNSPDYESKSSYSVRVRTTDQGGLTYEEAFAITINDLNETTPSVTISTTAASTTGVSPIPVTITFSESVTGFVVGDVTVSGGTKSNFNGSGDTYTLDITPSGNGTITVDVAANAAQNGLAIGNTAATQLSLVYNASCGTMEAAPYYLKSRVSLSPALNNFAANDNTGWTSIHRYDTDGQGNTWSAATSLPFSFTFMGQAVTQFCVSKNYLLTFTPSVAGSAVSALIADNTTLPNANLPANTIAYFWDNFHAPPSGTQDDAIYTRVYGSAPNRQLWIRNHSYVTEGMTFSYGIVVLEETTNRIYVIDLRNATANAGSRTVGVQKNTNAYVQDPASPNITSVNGNVTGDAFPTAKYWIFEPLSGTTETSVHYNTAPSVFNLVAPPLGGSGAFSYLWQQSTDNSTWSSAAGTNNQATYQAPSLTETTYFRRKVTDNTCGDELFDGKQKVTVTSPPVSVTISSTKTSPTNSSPIPVKIDFAEDVVGFGVDDISVTGATKSNFAGSGKNYTVDILPSGNGTITVDVPAEVAETPGGHSANLAATQFSITYDGTKPAVTLSSTTASPTNSNLIPLKIDFSENITGFTVGDLVITGGTADNFSGAGQHYSIDVSPTVYGEITVDVAADLVLDAAGNGNTAATQFKISHDNLKPTVTISSTVAGPTGVTPIPVSIAFSENVTGFDLADVAVTGGTSADFSGSGKNYSLNVTPSADGTITVNVAANAAVDQAGNGSVIATPFSMVYTSCTPPVITSAPVDRTICSMRNTGFTVSATGSNLTYQWQVDNGAGFTTITDAGVYQGSTTATLTLTQASYAYNGYKYRVVVSGACDPATSLPAVLTVLPPIEAGQIAANQTVWYGDAAAELSNVQNASGADGQLVYQWERSADGNNFSAIAGANASTYAPGVMNENAYFRRSVSNACGTANSNVVTITVTRYELDKDLIPNALFPNGTTRNQTWGISHLGLTDAVEVRVFDSAGRLVFYTNDAQQEWDGKHKGKDAPEGTYFYTIEIAGEKVQGSIQIVY